MANTLSIDGFETGEVIDISGTLSTNRKLVRAKIREQLPWTEKYRPKSIEDVILDPNILQKIRKVIEEKNMPSIIITGVPGIGKTTTIKCIANGLYGPNVKDAVLELNASDERGIKTVDELISNFCRKSFDVGKEWSKHKMIILDEADNITTKAQHSINKMMETYNSTTRFAFTCNESTDILETIQSRCIILRYVRLSMEKVVEKLENICKIEKVPYVLDALKEIATISQGDMRGAINNLQAIYNGTGSVTVDNVYISCDKPQLTRLMQILIECKNRNSKIAFNLMRELKLEGYSNSDIVLGFMSLLKVIDSHVLTDPDKIYILNKVCRTAYIVSKGVNTDVQMYGLLSSIINGYIDGTVSV
jgi:replication factor C subunit 2/4